MESVVEESQSGVGAVSRPVGFQDMEMDQSLLELAQQDYGMVSPSGRSYFVLRRGWNQLKHVLRFVVDMWKRTAKVQLVI